VTRARVTSHRRMGSQLGTSVALSFVAHAVLLWIAFLLAGAGKRPTPMPEVYHVQFVEPPRRTQADAVRDAVAPAPVTPERAAARTDAPAGFSPGVSSSLTVDVENFPFLYYLAALRNKVSGNWSPSGSSEARTVVFFRVYRDGSLADSYLETSSGNVVFDQAALRAVVVSEPFPPLPDEFNGTNLGVHFAFQYSLEE
jgi:TonB family protein